MSHKAVMQQALEALLVHAETPLDMNPPRVIDEAVDALRAALAEPEPRPVVHMFECKATGFTDFHFTPNWYDPSGWKRTPLYTTPPQRKPLTDEQILDCFQQRSTNAKEYRRLITRAIERAHGITE